MSDFAKKKPSPSLRRRIFILLFGAVLALLLFGLRTLTGPPGGSVSFSVAESDASASLGKHPLVLSSTRCALYDEDGAPLYSTAVRLQAPALCAGKNRALVYDIGGTQCLLLKADGAARTLTTEAPVSFATMNRRGLSCVVTRPDTCRGLVTVYSADGGERLLYGSAEDAVLSARVSPNGKRLAVTTLTDTGSRAELLNLRTGETYAVFTVDSRVALDVLWLNDHRLVMLTASQALFFSDDGCWLGTFSFNGQTPQRVAADESGFLALALSPASSGINGTLYTLDTKGEVLGSADYTGRLLSLDVRGRRVLALDDGGLTLYRSSAEVIGSVSLRGVDTAFLTGRRAALLLGASAAEYYCF